MPTIGEIDSALIDTLPILDSTAAVRGDICHARDNFMAVVYHEDSTANTILATFRCDLQGNLPAGIQSSVVVDTSGAGAGPHPSIIKVSDGTVAVAFDEATTGPTIKTYTVDVNGNLSSVVGTQDMGTGTFPRVYIERTKYANVFACLWNDSNFQVSTCTIDTSGNISAVVNTQIISSDGVPDSTPCLVYTGQGDYHASAFRGAGGDGFVSTFTIDSAGNISAVTKTLEFDTSNAQRVSMGSNEQGIVIILSEGPSSSGDLDTVLVDASGNITAGDDISVMSISGETTTLLRLDDGSKNVFLGASNSTFRSWSIDGSGNITAVDTLASITEINDYSALTFLPSSNEIIVGCGYKSSTTEFFVFSLFVEVALPAFIERANAIVLDDKEYAVRGRVRSGLSPTFAPKQVIGDVTSDSHLDVSYLRWDDWSEGIGLEEFFAELGGQTQTPKRAWYSTCDLNSPKHLVLGPLLNAIADPPEEAGSTSSNPASIVTFKNEVYAAYTNTISAAVGNRVYKYDNSGNSWGSALNIVGASGRAQNLLAAGFVGGTEQIFHAAVGDYGSSSDGSSWTDRAKDAYLLAIWDDRLWGVTIDGAAWWSASPGTEIDIAPVPVPPNSGSGRFATFLSRLFAARWTDGDEHLFCSTGIGLFIYDIEQDRWILTDVRWPHNRFAGRGAVVWNGDMYIPAGMGMYRVIVGDQIAVVPVGLDRDHGLPTANRGAIFQAENGFNQLMAALTTDIDDIPNLPSTALGIIFGYNGKGWQVLAELPSGEDVQAIHVSSAYGLHRLWALTRTSSDVNAYYIDLPVDLPNPSHLTSRARAASGTHDTPHFRVGNDVTGLALSLVAEVEGASANETVTISYDINASGSFTAFTAITSDGNTEFPFPNATSPAGSEFRSIQFRIALARGGTTTNTPDLRSLTFKFLKKLPERWMHRMTLDITQEFGGFSPREQWDNLRTSINKAALLEFTMKDDASAASSRRHWVRVATREGDEETGLEYRGEVDLILVEPQHLN